MLASAMLEDWSMNQGGATLGFGTLPALPAGGLGTEYAQAVARVKAVQRSDCGHELWKVWCDMRGGKKDPALRPLQELLAFLAEADPGNIITPDEVKGPLSLPASEAGLLSSVAGLSWQAWPSPQLLAKASCTLLQPASREHAQLIECVKAFQKRPGGHDLWKAFCERQGGGKRDPAARRIQELQEFLAEMDAGGAAVQITGSMTNHERMVVQIRQGQRNSDSFKQAWWRHCAGLKNGKDIADPAKHSLESLQSFMAKAPLAAPVQEDEEHTALVMQVKQGQRTSEVFRGAWYTYCSEKGTQKNDPARHDKGFLQDFLATPLAQRARPNSEVSGSVRYSPY